MITSNCLVLTPLQVSLIVSRSPMTVVRHVFYGLSQLHLPSPTSNTHGSVLLLNFTRSKVWHVNKKKTSINATDWLHNNWASGVKCTFCWYPLHLCTEERPGSVGLGSLLYSKNVHQPKMAMQPNEAWCWVNAWLRHISMKLEWECRSETVSDCDLYEQTERVDSHVFDEQLFEQITQRHQCLLH